jgi:rod shape-determining protein MreC
MESSRDDFVIAIRSAFLKKGNKQRFSLIFLIFFSIIFLVLGKLNFKGIDYFRISIKEIVYRSSFIASLPENYIKSAYEITNNHFYMYNDYNQIQSEIGQLKSEKILNNFIIQENKRLKKIIDDYVAVSDVIVAKVLIDKKSPFLRSIIINKGSKDNIKLGMAVIENDYLVGKVVEVNFTTSRILLLSDLNSKIPVTIEPGGFQSILSGTGRNNGKIQYLKEDYTIEEESIVYTSGSGGLFKAGIPIGKIKDILSKEKKIEFFSDFSQLRFVKVISFQKESN